MADERIATSAQLRLVFAAWWGRLLCGYQDYLVPNLVPEAGGNGSLESVLHAEGLIDSREAECRPLLRRLLQSQGLVRLLEQVLAPPRDCHEAGRVIAMRLAA